MDSYRNNFGFDKRSKKIMGEIKFVTSLVLISLFTIAILSYVINFGCDNNSEVRLTDDAEFNSSLNSIKSEVTTFKSQTNSSSKGFFESEIAEGSDTTKTGGAFKVGLGTMLDSLNVVSSVVFSKIFGNDIAFGIFLTAFSALMVYIGFRYILQTWLGRSP